MQYTATELELLGVNYYMKACGTGDTSYFLKQLIVFMPELNEKDYTGQCSSQMESQD